MRRITEDAEQLKKEELHTLKGGAELPPVPPVCSTCCVKSNGGGGNN